MTPSECEERIAALLRAAEEKLHEIEKIAKAHIPKYHFLNERVILGKLPDFLWHCDKSPIGVCVFAICQDADSLSFGRPQNCIFCKEPVERK